MVIDLVSSHFYAPHDRQLHNEREREKETYEYRNVQNNAE